MAKHRIFTTSVASVYPHYVAKAEKKGRTKAEVNEVMRWLTGYSQDELDARLSNKTDFETFFAEAPRMNPARSAITGVICGVRIEEIEEPTMREIRYLDKMVDELAKGKTMAKILRTPEQPALGATPMATARKTAASRTTARKTAGRKTTATSDGPGNYIAAIADEARRHDCERLATLMARASKQPAVMWGTAIVGFGVHRYALAGGKQGEICAVGFSSRKSDIALYGLTDNPDASTLLANLGTHTLGKSCVYLRKLADIDRAILEKLIAKSMQFRQA